MMPAEASRVTELARAILDGEGGRALGVSDVLRLNVARMKRALTLYFSFVGATIVAFAVGSSFDVRFDDGSAAAIARFLSFFVALACAAGAWYTSVMIASVHRVAWPLALSMTLVIAFCVRLAVKWFVTS